MRWRLIVLAVGAVLLAATTVLAVEVSAKDSYQSQVLYGSNPAAGQPSQAQQDEANRLGQRAGAIAELVMPMALGSITCVVGILFVLGRRRQLDEAAI